MLERFLGKNVIIVLSGIKLLSQDEEGTVGELPMMCEGILVDFDEKDILITNTEQTAFSMINRNHIAKIDMVDELEMLMLDAGKPSPLGMN